MTYVYLILEWLGWFTLASPVLLWLGFYLFFHVWGNQTKLNDLKAFSYIQLALGFLVILIDAYVDIVIGTVIFLQWPSVQRLMLSTRMDDLIINGSGYRQKLAILIVGVLLEPFDKTGQHSTHGKTL